MASEVVVDSTVFMKLLRCRRDPAQVLCQAYGLGSLAVCGMIRLEVLRGLRDPRLCARIAALMDVMINVPSDNRLWTEATELAWKLDRQGRALPGADVVIAASALRIGAAVLTFDAHFQQIDGLRVIAPPEEWFRKVSWQGRLSEASGAGEREAVAMATLEPDLSEKGPCHAP